MSSAVERLRRQCAQMREIASMPDEARNRVNGDVSGWCAAEHVDHLTKVSRAMLRRLVQPDATPLDKGINMIGRVVLTVGRIPRGKGKSPEKLRGACVAPADLLSGIDEMEALLDRLDASLLAASRGPLIGHPRFGGLRPMQALRFLLVHNDHHFRIVRDIGRS